MKPAHGLLGFLNQRLRLFPHVLKLYARGFEFHLGGCAPRYNRNDSIFLYLALFGDRVDFHFLRMGVCAKRVLYHICAFV